jgi:hypothetical protein
MKSREHHAADDTPVGGVVAMAEDLVDLDETTDRAVAFDGGHGHDEPPVQRAGDPDRDVSRGRRSTVVSPLPALLAQSMGQVRDPAAPARAYQDVTRPVGVAADGRPSGDSGTSYRVEIIDRSQGIKGLIAGLIDDARACMDTGDLGGAVLAADRAMAEAGHAPSPAVAEIIAPARPLMDRIFASYVGLLGQVPVKAFTEREISVQPLDDHHRALLAAIDGVMTLEQVLRASRVPAVEAVRIAASLLHGGIIRFTPA